MFTVVTRVTIVTMVTKVTILAMVALFPRKLLKCVDLRTFSILLYSFFWVIPRRLYFMWLFHLHRSCDLFTRPMKMELTECSETSPHKIQTPGIHPKERVQQSQDGEILKWRIISCLVKFSFRLLDCVHSVQYSLEFMFLDRDICLTTFVFTCRPQGRSHHFRLDIQLHSLAVLRSWVSVSNFCWTTNPLVYGLLWVSFMHRRKLFNGTLSPTRLLLGWYLSPLGLILRWYLKVHQY